MKITAFSRFILFLFLTVSWYSGGNFNVSRIDFMMRTWCIRDVYLVDVLPDVVGYQDVRSCFHGVSSVCALMCPLD